MKENSPKIKSSHSNYIPIYKKIKSIWIWTKKNESEQIIQLKKQKILKL